jgi:hypothetical protein
MKTSSKIILGVIGAVLVAIGLVTFNSSHSVNLGGTVENFPSWFNNGLRVGRGTGAGYFVGGNSGDTTFGIATTTNGTNPIFSLSSTGALTVKGAFTQGGGVGTVATTSTTYTLASTDFDTENIVSVTPGGASLTLTLPASSTFPLGTTVGSEREIFVVNATTTSGINITMATTTGVFLRTSSSTAIIQSDTAGAKGAVLRAVRKANSDILVYMTSFNN